MLFIPLNKHSACIHLKMHGILYQKEKADDMADLLFFLKSDVIFCLFNEIFASIDGLRGVPKRWQCHMPKRLTM